MPKAFGREIPTWMLVGGALCVVALAYNQISGGEEAPPTKTAKKTKKATSTLSTQITEQDLTAKFAAYNEPAKNSFKPLIVKATPGPGLLGVIKPMDPGGVSTLLTGGEANWFYTGHVEVNGRAQALLENTSTGESVYLSEGDKWKSARVADVTAEKVVFSGSSGPVTVALRDPNEQKRTPGVNATGGIAPMNPAPGLTGTIGGQVAGNQAGALPVPGQPNAAVSPSPMDGLTVQPDVNTRGRRRGRRNGGNWGGGAPQ